MASVETIVSIILYILRVLLILPTVFVVHKECLNRRNVSKNTDRGRNINIYQKFLSIFSLTSMILTVLSLINCLSLVFKKLCVFGNAFLIIFAWGSKLFLGFFQVTRLQYAFSASRIQTGYGYPKCWFMILYSMGVIILIYCIFCGLFVFTDTWTQEKFGEFVYYCRGENVALRYGILNPVLVALALVWDWMVIGCYVAKICQFYKYDYNMKIRFVLYKILYLTCLYQVTTALAMIIGGPIVSVLVGNKTLYPTMIGSLFVCLEHFWFVCIIYLMMDHNNDAYLKVIKIIHKFGGLCCCKSFVAVTLSQNNGEYRLLENESNVPTIAKAATLQTHTNTNLVMSQMIAK